MAKSDLHFYQKVENMTNLSQAKEKENCNRSDQEMKNQYDNHFESRFEELKKNDLLLENKVDELLSHVKLLEEHFIPKIKEKEFESANYKRICEIIDKFEKSHSDFTSEEIELSQMYNELLQHPFLLRKIELTQHHRILSKALEFNCQAFDHQKFIEFIIESISKYEKYEIQSLLVYFDETSFSECLNSIEQLKANPHFVVEYLTHRNDRYWNLFDRLFNDDHQIQEVKKQNEEVLNTVQNNQNEIKTILKEHFTLFKELHKEQQQQNVSIEENQTKCFTELTKEIDRLRTEIQSLSVSNEELKKQNLKLCEDFHKQINQIDETIKSQYQESNELMRNEMKSISTKTDQLCKLNELEQKQTTTLNIIQQMQNHLHYKCPFVCLSQFNGILNYLSCKGGVQLISGHKEIAEEYKVTNLIDYSNTGNTRYDAEADSETNYFECHFFNRKIDLSSYQIKSYSSDPNRFHPKTWEIKGSNNRTQWDLLDHRENCSDLNGNSITKHFICQQATHKRYQYIRFYLYDTWHSDKRYQYNLFFSRFELYGDIYRT